MSNGTGAINLDYWAAFHAQNIVKLTINIGTTVTKTMGVLQEHGVYACFLYLYAKEKETCHGVINEMLDLLYHIGYCWEENKKPDAVEDVLNFVNENVGGGSLERLLFAKETLEQMLIYARYGAKATEKITPPNATEEAEMQDDADDSILTGTEIDQEKTS